MSGPRFPYPVPMAVGGYNKVLDDITWLTGKGELKTGEYDLFMLSQIQSRDAKYEKLLAEKDALIQRLSHDITSPT